MDEIYQYIVYVNHGSLTSPIFSLTLKAFKKNFFKHVIGIFCLAISTLLLDIAVKLSLAFILVLFL